MFSMSAPILWGYNVPCAHTVPEVAIQSPDFYIYFFCYIRPIKSSEIFILFFGTTEYFRACLPLPEGFKHLYQTQIWFYYVSNVAKSTEN